MSTQEVPETPELSELRIDIASNGFGLAGDRSYPNLPPSPHLCTRAILDTFREVANKFLALTERLAVALESLRSDNVETLKVQRLDVFTDSSHADPRRESVEPIATTRRAAQDVQEVHDTLSALQSQVQEVLNHVKSKSMQNRKDCYTVADVARETPYTEWTIRRACSLGRIAAAKSDDGKWRIPYDEVERIRNHGLPPLT